MPEDSLLDEKIKSHWDEIKETIRRECGLSQIVYGTWIEPLIFERYESETAYILISHNNRMAIDYINKRFNAFFVVAISELIGIDSLQVVYIISDDVANTVIREKKNEEHRIQQGSRLKSKFTFESFVVGDSNRFAYSAAVAVAEDPGNAYNPLFLYGGPGLGKTHLLQAIGNYILHNTPEKAVLYVTSEEFTNEVVEHIMKGEPEKLRDKYRNVDVLMVDDVQFIVGKNSTQLEFFHTFNSLYQEGKQIVLSSDRHPKEIENLDERFRSRFEMGLTSDIQTPDYETRMAILRRLQEGNTLKVDDNVLEYIATGVVSNVRELEGAYTKIVAYSRLNKLTDTLACITGSIAEAYCGYIKNTELKDILLEKLPENIKRIADEFELKYFS
ncbi:chromosomal replication initiator protein DnaA [Butyrivibrio sp. WCD2001]|uniref:chromosomal replication initiator protein DnaA n=1 Tax=Butyrivibrio sp. WCD2001 TaxID=1280681 RepID=UPI000427B49C|nr:chromosomal replication initiator protein DnaA [Butyrivibrio sp. WCD2001]